MWEIFHKPLALSGMAPWRHAVEARVSRKHQFDLNIALRLRSQKTLAPLCMAVAKSLDESPLLWRGFNANYANRAKVAKVRRKFAIFASFATFALRTSGLCYSHTPLCAE
jgi:hypothetical protein